MKRFIPAIILAVSPMTSIYALESESALPDEAVAPAKPTVVLSPAEDTPSLFKLGVDVRADWQLLRHGVHTDNGDTGFEGKFLMVRIDGSIVKGLTYSWRQRLNRISSDYNFFDHTDWLYINYQIGRWNFQAGKEIVAIGGMEYDRYPLDMYAGSCFFNSISCFQFGVSGAYDITPSDRLTAQVTQSPFYTRSNRNMYSYNLLWSGKHGIFKALYSANLLEYAKGKYISYLMLGNRFDVGPVYLELDLMNRAASHQTFFFKDFSVVGEIGWTISPRWKLQGKISYDVNNAHNSADLTVLPGTELTMAGGDVEFYPLLKNKHRLRLHAGCWYSWGRNANAADAMQDKTLFISAGITWNMDLLNIRRK